MSVRECLARVQRADRRRRAAALALRALEASGLRDRNFHAFALEHDRLSDLMAEAADEAVAARREVHVHLSNPEA